MSGKASNITPPRMPNAVLAWECLRRNSEYRSEYNVKSYARPQTVKLTSGATIIRLRRQEVAAEKWGLLAFADPSKRAGETAVFWKPGLLAGALEVSLSIATDTIAGADMQDMIMLSSLNARRILLDTNDGNRHILLGGDRFWIQLFCKDQAPVGDQVEIGIRLDGTQHLGRRLDAAAQLLSLYRSRNGKLSLIGRRRPSRSVANAISAFDIFHGFERPKGSLKDIAELVAGKARVARDWGANDLALKAQAKRAIKRGEQLVQREYRDFLIKKSL